MITLKNLLEDIEFSQKSLDKVQKLLKINNYGAFVKALKSALGDNEVVTILKSGQFDGSIADEKISVSGGSFSVKKLIPTQNEIDIDNSLSFQLTGKGQIQQLLSGGNLTIAGPLLVMSGKYILDGHHRWSQAYCFNPDIALSCINLSGFKDPISALKAVQMAIAAELGDVPVRKVSGQNMLTAGKSNVVNYVVNHITDKVTQDIINSDKFLKWAKSKSEYRTREALELLPIELRNIQVALYIWENIQLMQSKNKPVSGAGSRGNMPQSDKAPGIQADLSAGENNFKEPLTLTK